MFAGVAALADLNQDYAEMAAELDLDTPGQRTQAATSALSWTGTLSDAEAAVVARAMRAAERADARVSRHGEQPPALPCNGPVVKRHGSVLKRPAAGSGVVAAALKRPAQACEGQASTARGKAQRQVKKILKRPAAMSR